LRNTNTIHGIAEYRRDQPIKTDVVCARNLPRAIERHRVNLTLGIVLPVSNAEWTLRRQVQDLLDTLPDLVSRFEILIVDDGSTDQTAEVAHELAIQYPQVRVIRQPHRKGSQAALDAAVRLLDADLILMVEDGAPLRTSDVQRVMSGYAQSLPGPIPGDLLGRLTAWGRAIGSARPTAPNRGRSSNSFSPTAAPVLRRSMRHRNQGAQGGR
jgi:glycosyltransferase involved in cell wall biosynthesis